MKPVVVIQGAATIYEVPRLDELVGQAELRFASSDDELQAMLPGAEVLLAWNFRAGSLRKAWAFASDLRWIHWCGAGVDAAMFPELVESEVEVTNARGIFDAAMAEWVLGMILCFAKLIPQTLELQARAEWKHRLSETLARKRVLIVGIGSIGRCIGRLLQAVGMTVEVIGRSARATDADFAQVYAVGELRLHLANADYVVLITPLTEQTRNLFGAAEFKAMAKHARFINLGRGALVDEEALLCALHEGQIAGAALDVFVEEPLPAGNPLWKAPNCIITPHNSGDYIGYETAIADQFMTNWARYLGGRPMLNVVDKTCGFHPGVVG